MAEDDPFTALGAADGAYSRTCWLPVLGPTAWVLWGTIGHELVGDSIVVHDAADLTGALGLGRPQRLMRALQRLDRFGVATNPDRNDDGCWELPEMSPPLPPHHHATASDAARRFHHQTLTNLADTERETLRQIFTPTYLDHFGRHHE